MSAPTSFPPPLFFPPLSARHALHDDAASVSKRVREWLSGGGRGVDDFGQPDVSLLIGPSKT